MQRWRYTAPVDEHDAILLRHLPLVRRVARGFLGRVTSPVELEDLIAWGALGLLDAMARYDPARESLFATYARFRIRGAILDQLRDLDWIPRSVRDKAAAVERAARTLEAKLGRPATDEEMACALGLSLPAYRDLAERIAPMAMVSLDDPGCAALDADLPLEGVNLDPLGGVLRQERLRLVADAIRRLPERDQLLLSLYYRDDLTMKEVGSVLGLTESRVSQLHTRALLGLRAQLRDSVPAMARTA